MNAAANIAPVGGTSTAIAADEVLQAVPAGPIGILFESDEWSDYKLADELRELGHEVRMIDVERDSCTSAALGCPMLVNRVFASAWTRGHGESLVRMGSLLPAIAQAGISIVNPLRAHLFETSKALSARTLAERGIGAPEVFGVAKPADLIDLPLRFPCVVKPDCGGRGTCTGIIRDAVDLSVFALGLPAREDFVAEAYCEPAFGYTTRIEIIGGECALVVKRSVVENGMSGYHWGSEYELYPDCPDAIREAARTAAACLDFELGSFDVVEAEDGFFFIDCNSVTNVSEDNTEMFGMDLMREHARYIDRRFKEAVV